MSGSENPRGRKTRRLIGKVLVLGSDTRAFLTVVRSLGRAGLSVHIAWCPEGAPARRSRYVSIAHDIALYASSDNAWRAALIALMQREQFDLVIPCDDPSLLPLQQHRALLEPHGRIYLLDDVSLSTTVDKSLTYALAVRTRWAPPFCPSM